MDGKRGLEDGDHYGGKRARVEDPSAASKVLHVRNVDPNNSHEELLSFVSQFGAVASICFLSKFNQALIEMDSVQAASSVIMYSKSTPVFVTGKEVHFSYSKSQNINTQARQAAGSDGAAGAAAGGISNILLCTILNPLFSITVDVIHAIMSPFGTVYRIVIFGKNGVQALVEFDSPMPAAQAKAALEGKDIYAGSCTLKIEFSRSTKLNVHVNNDKTRDYTNITLPAGPPGAPPALGMGAMGYPGVDPAGYYGGAAAYGVPAAAEPATRSVLIVYGFDDTFTTPDRVFNLFCLYGNVNKVKVLPNKKGTLIQMGDNTAADYASQNLNGLQVFGQQLQIQYSKHPYIADSRQDSTADPAAAPTTKDFSSSTLNRFRTPNPNAYKHIYRPSQTIYFSNAPKEYTEDSFLQLFSSQNVVPPVQIKFFSLPANPAKGGEASERRIGLMEFSSPTAAAEALIIANNQRLGSHTLKLAFSQNSINSQSNPNPNTTQLGNPTTEYYAAGGMGA
jgi:RNA recognition motif-containing protein